MDIALHKNHVDNLCVCVKEYPEDIRNQHYSLYIYVCIYIYYKCYDRKNKLCHKYMSQNKGN